MELAVKNTVELENGVTIKTLDSLQIKDWFCRNLCNEKNSSVSNHIYNIIKETEKAVYGILSGTGTRAIYTWIPKSAIELDTTERYANEPTRFIDDFETAKNDYNVEMSVYR